MVDNSWIGDLQTSIFSRVKAIGLAKLKSTYPSISFTTNPVDPKDAKFPTVYLHEISIVETNRDLEGNTVNSIVYTIQLDVFANDSNRTDSKKISYVLLDIMKSMLFESSSPPITQHMDNVTKSVSRFKRNISRGDII